MSRYAQLNVIVSRRGCERHTIYATTRRASARKSILRPEAACPPSNYLAKKKEAEVSKRMLLTLGSFGFLRLTARLVLFFNARARAHGRCNRTLRHFCQKCIVHSVCNLRSSYHLAIARIASRIVGFRVLRFAGSFEKYPFTQ